MGYTKLFSSIVASTIWREDDKTRIVWITMLAMKNERHVVEASLPGLADMARVSLKECQAAVSRLESKDRYSRNQENEGRRIRQIAGGWEILNGEHYRRLMSEADRREYQRLYHRKYRAEKKKSEGKTQDQVSAENQTREKRYCDATSDEQRDQIVGEDLPGNNSADDPAQS